MVDVAKRVLIYAHFDPEEHVEPFVHYALSACREVCGRLIFVSNSPVSESDRRSLAAWDIEVHVRPNAGLDFGMWKFGLEQVDLGGWDEIVLLNSSVYGPVFPLKEAFSLMERRECDVWGITDSFVHSHHLQSYFLVFGKQVIQSDAFAEFWASVLPYETKQQVIFSYELGLSRWLEERGFRMGALCPWPELVRRACDTGTDRSRKSRRPRRRLANPSVKYPIELLAMKAPFVKKSLFWENPYRIDLDRFRADLVDTGYPEENLVAGAPTRRRRSCPACGATGRRIYERLNDRTRGAFQGLWSYEQCRQHSCGLLWLTPDPTAEELRAAYRDYFTHGTAVPHGHRRPEYSHATRRLLKWLRAGGRRLDLHVKRKDFYLHELTRRTPGRLLEVGCGSGARLAALRELGWDVEGQEVDEIAAEQVRRRGLKVHLGRLDEITGPASYDWILMSHVIEHVFDPLYLLQSCLRLLRPGGRIVGTTPNVRALGRAIYRANWFPLDPPRHLLLFTPEALEKMLVEAGFEDAGVSTVPYNMELISMFSRDIRTYGCTDSIAESRVGTELVPAFLQLCALPLARLLPRTGEECFFQARRPPASTRDAADSSPRA